MMKTKKKTMKANIKKFYRCMNTMTKEDVMDVIQVYQEYTNRFINIDKNDLNKIYVNVAKRGTKRIIKNLINE